MLKTTRKERIYCEAVRSPSLVVFNINGPPNCWGCYEDNLEAFQFWRLTFSVAGIAPLETSLVIKALSSKCHSEVTDSPHSKEKLVELCGCIGVSRWFWDKERKCGAGCWTSEGQLSWSSPAGGRGRAQNHGKRRGHNNRNIILGCSHVCQEPFLDYLSLLRNPRRRGTGTTSLWGLYFREVVQLHTDTYS